MPIPGNTSIQTRAVWDLARLLRRNLSRRLREMASPGPLAIGPRANSLRWSSWCSLSVLVLGCGFGRLQAEIPAPDNLVYGTITLSGQLIGSNATNVVIEARRSLSGPVVASYRMGADPAAGNFYLLRLQLEEIAPVANSLASLAGQSVFLVVRDPTGDRANLSYTIANRGSVTRLDFGSSSSGGDSDQDGLPDTWELAKVGTLNSRPSDDPFGKGSSLLADYTAGTNPQQPNDTFHLNISQATTN